MISQPSYQSLQTELVESAPLNLYFAMKVLKVNSGTETFECEICDTELLDPSFETGLLNRSFETELFETERLDPSFETERFETELLRLSVETGLF